MTAQIRLVVGLGNPGCEYARTRHNIGFMVVDAIAERHGLRWTRDQKALGWVAKGNVGESQVLLLKPNTYMNLSGRAVSRCLSYYHLSVDEMLVIADDADLQLGQLRLREQGGSGGHKGLKSIQDALRSQGYARLKIGIGRGEGRGDLAERVLEAFSKEELPVLERLVPRSADVVEQTLRQPLQEVMKHANVFEEDRKDDGKKNAKASL